jgi:hypothetical protein
MNYIKKMCILRQIRQGFSGDGKTLSGLVKVEQYGKNLAVEVSIINFAPLSLGEYYCLLSDGRGKTEMLSLRGKSMFNILSDVDVSSGFCAIICFVKNEVVPIAYGINGNGSYDYRAILNATLPPVFPKKRDDSDGEIASAKRLENKDEKSNAPVVEIYDNNAYDDDRVAEKNYYKEQVDEREQFEKVGENARRQGANQGQNAEEGANFEKNDDAQELFQAFETSPDGYYLSVKRELDALFSAYPKDETLKDAFSCGEWVRIRGTVQRPEYLVGVVYEDGKAKYVCYALRATNGENAPDEIKGVCTFVPVSALVDVDGFFVIFQSASTGQCVKPVEI